MCLGIDPTSLRNCTGGFLNSILPKYIATTDGDESAVSPADIRVGYIYICMTIYTSGTHSNQLAAWRTALPINTLCTATQPRKCASEQKYTSLNKCGWDLVTEGYGVWWHYYNNIIFIHIKPSSEPSCPVNGDIVTIIRTEMLQPWIKVMSQNSIVLICSDSSL